MRCQPARLTTVLQTQPLVSIAAQGLIQLCVIVEKDEVGYGLTVSGDKPVYVQSVKESKSGTHIIIIQ